MIEEKKIKAVIAYFEDRAAKCDKKGKFVDSRIERDFAYLVKYILGEEQDTWDDDVFKDFLEEER